MRPQGPVLEALFEPARIGAMTVKNRIVMPPMATGFATDDGLVSQRHLDYYAARAKGGAGLIIVEFACVDYPVGKVGRQLCIDHDRCLPGLRRLADAIKNNGARAAIQIHHAGREARTKFTGLQPVAPSPIPAYRGADMPRELTIDEIAGIVGRYAEAAERAKKAGFDAVEVHSASGYLAAEFLSADANHRTDRYGGAIEDRARFLLEIISTIRARVGRDYLMWCRLNSREFGIPNGTTPEESRLVARMAERASVDAIHMSAWGRGLESDAPMKPDPGYLLPYAEAMRRAVKVPVIAVGRLDAVTADAAVREGKADFVAVGRGLITDPDLPAKAASGRLEDIVPCISCLRCAEEVVYGGRSLLCSVNPTAGIEPECAIRPASRKRRVMVVGGGPAGMEAARVAALRGHDVSLYEKEDRLGGQLVPAVTPPTKDRLKPFLEYLTGQVTKAGVKLHTGKNVTAATIDALEPDVAVLASGVEPVIPEIPGLDRARVAPAEDVLLGKANVSGKALVIGGELVGCEVADVLSEQGVEVTVTRRGSRMAASMMPIMRRQLLDRLASKGVRLITGVNYERANREGVIITDSEGRRQTIPADVVVLAAGSTPNARLKEAFKERGIEVHLAGDCVRPSSIMEAMRDGFMAGRDM